MARFRFRDARVWSQMIASIEKILDEGVFVANSEGLSLRALDTSHVVMVDLFYPAESFSEYQVEEGGEEFDVSFSVLSRLLKRARKGDELVISSKDSYIVIELAGRGSRRFRVPEVSLALERLPEPKISFTVRAAMLGSTFTEAITTLQPMAESMTITAYEEGRLVFLGRGDVGQAEVESPDSSTYSIEYFSEMLSAARVADTVKPCYTADAPARVDLEYQAGGRLRFYVSPRVE